MQPPKKCADTITTGTATVTRASSAVSKNVCTAPRLTRYAYPLYVDVGQTQQKIKRPNAVQRLQFQGLGQLVVALRRVAVAHHVVGEDHRAHAGERGAPLLGGFERSAFERSRMPVRTQNNRTFTRHADRYVKITRHKVARQALERDVLDGIALHSAQTVTQRFERGKLRPVGELHTGADAPPDQFGALLPGLAGWVGFGGIGQPLGSLGFGKIRPLPQFGVVRVRLGQRRQGVAKAEW